MFDLQEGMETLELYALQQESKVLQFKQKGAKTDDKLKEVPTKNKKNSRFEYNGRIFSITKVPLGWDLLISKVSQPKVFKEIPHDGRSLKDVKEIAMKYIDQKKESASFDLDEAKAEEIIDISFFVNVRPKDEDESRDQLNIFLNSIPNSWDADGESEAGGWDFGGEFPAKDEKKVVAKIKDILKKMGIKKYKLTDSSSKPRKQKEPSEEDAARHELNRKIWDLADKGKTPAKLNDYLETLGYKTTPFSEKEAEAFMNGKFGGAAKSFNKRSKLSGLKDPLSVWIRQFSLYGENIAGKPLSKNQKNDLEKLVGTVRFLKYKIKSL